MFANRVRIRMRSAFAGMLTSQSCTADYQRRFRACFIHLLAHVIANGCRIAIVVLGIISNLQMYTNVFEKSCEGRRFLHWLSRNFELVPS